MPAALLTFWIELTLLALLACALVYGILSTRSEVARRKGADAVALLRRNARRLKVLVAGTAVILLGIIISPLPGPGFSVLAPIGLAILASEFVWARRLAAQIKERSGPLREATRRVARVTPRWVVIPVCAAYWAGAAAIAIWTPVPAVILWPAASILFAPVFLWAYLTLKPPQA